MKHIQTLSDSVFSYFDGMFWFAGVIESISDPTMQGRVQVRCIGIHPDSKSLVPTADLPWAHVMLPTTSAGVSGIGSTHGLIEGSWVIGFFADGRAAQQPIVMGTIPGNPNPSRIQEQLLNAGQSIAQSGTEGVDGLIQSTRISNVTSVVKSGLGPSISDSNNAIDLSSYKEALDSGLSSNSVDSTIQKNSILNLVGTSTDIRSSQIYNGISTNSNLNSSSGEGSNILSYIERYTGKNGLNESLGYDSLIKDVNYNKNSKAVDVNVNYEKALDNSIMKAGLISIEHNYTRKSSTSNDISKLKNISDYHFVITAQGQIFPKESLEKSIDKNDSLSKIISSGISSNNIRICLIGGLPDDKKYDNTAGFFERFTKQQFSAATRLIRTLLKKYPKAVIDGQNNLAKDGSGKLPNFDVTETFKEKFPNNVNVSKNGNPKIAGTDSIPTQKNDINEYTDPRGFHDPRGIYPSVNYGPDYPILARYNSISNKKKVPNVINSIKGNITKFALHEPRNANDRTAVGIVDPVKLNSPDWGGEYGMTHVIRETPGGHAIYADDTPGKERLLLHASTGSTIDMRPDGTVSIMSQGNHEELVDGFKTIVTNGDSAETINGTKKLKIAGDFILEVGGRFSIVSKETNEFISGNKSSIVEGINKEIRKAGSYSEIGRDYSLEVGGNKQEIIAGAVVEQAGSSRSTSTTGNHTIKSNNMIDVTLGNRMTMTKGNADYASNGVTNIFSKGNMSQTSAGNIAVNSSGSYSLHSGSESELTSGGKLSLNGSQIGINSSGSMSLDGSHISMQEGTIASKTSQSSILTYEYPEKMQPVSSIANPESNPAATDFSFGPRHEMEAHDESGSGGSYGSSRSAFNSGSTRNSNSPSYGNAKTNLDPISLGNSAGTGCEVAKGLISRGMTEEAASAYAGAFMQESRYNPTALNSIGAYGLGQWTSSGNRKQIMQNYLGDRANTLDGQLDFVMHELKNNPNGNAGSAATTWKTSNLDEAIRSAAYYERFNGFESAKDGIYSGGEWGNRTGYAASIYKNCFNKDPGQFNPAPSFNPNAGLNGDSSNANGPNTGIGNGSEYRGNESNVNLPPLSDKYTDRNQKISEFFTLDDLLISGGNKFDMPEYIDTPSGRISADDIVANMSTLAVNVLDVITRRLGRVTVHSGLRPPAYNRKIGGAKNSQHMYGRASDITVAGYSPSEVWNYVYNNIPAAHGIGSYATFTHVDVRPSNRVTWSG